MKINFVYEFESSYGKLVNGINPSYLEFLFDDDFSFSKTNKEKFHKNIQHTIEYSKPSYLYQYDNSEEITVADLKKIDENDLYLYPLSTTGNIIEFLARGKRKHNTSFFFISERAKNYLRECSNFFIYLEHAGEPYFDSDELKIIYNLFKINKIPFDKLLIVNGSNSNKFTLDDFKEKYGIDKTPKLASYNWPLPFKCLELRSNLGLEKYGQGLESTFADISHINLKKEKKALILNRRLRFHRLIYMCLMFESDLLNDTLYSLDTSLNMMADLKEKLGVHPSLPITIPNEENEKIINGFDKLNAKEKNILDYDDFDYIHGFGMETKELYEKTFFSVVLETEFSKFQESFTEKVIKPIQHFHPFIVLGSPYTLKKLKSYGIQTFDSIWDESYDLEEDDWLRMKKVFELTKELINKSDEEWEIMLKQIKPILEHNRNILLKFDRGFILEKIKSNFVKEFYDNDIINIL